MYIHYYWLGIYIVELRNSQILSHIEEKTADYEERVALGIKGQYGWREFTYKGLGLLSRKIARYLIEDLGIKKGDGVAILSESKPEYGACVFASVLSGCVTIPLDIKLSIYELKSILSDCLPSVLLISQHYLSVALKLQKEIPEIKHIIINDEHGSVNDIKDIYSLPDKYDAKWRQRSSKSTAFIIYTSGTTGAPKGVEISFKNVNSLDLLQVQKSILGTYTLGGAYNLAGDTSGEHLPYVPYQKPPGNVLSLHQGTSDGLDEKTLLFCKPP